MRRRHQVGACPDQEEPPLRVDLPVDDHQGPGSIRLRQRGPR